LLLRNFKLSDDIAFRFSDRGWGEWPLTVEKYVGWLTQPDVPGEVINLFMDYETFGEHQWAETGIFDFMKHLPDYALKTKKLEFLTPSEVAEKYQPVSVLHTPHAFSWADEERDVTAWLGNELQDEAFQNLYGIRDMVHAVNDTNLNHVWDFLQTSDHFYYMATKWFSDGDVHSYFNPYDTPYEAFINYMNVFSDFAREVRLKFENREPAPAPEAPVRKEKPAAAKPAARSKAAKKTETKPLGRAAAKDTAKGPSALKSKPEARMEVRTSVAARSRTTPVEPKPAASRTTAVVAKPSPGRTTRSAAKIKA